MGGVSGKLQFFVDLLGMTKQENLTIVLGSPDKWHFFPNSDILIYQTAILHDAGTSGVETGEHGLERG